jgi:hypothetical protein
VIDKEIDSKYTMVTVEMINYGGSSNNRWSDFNIFENIILLICILFLVIFIKKIVKSKYFSRFC